MTQFRVVFYATRYANKYEAEDRHEYLCDREAAFRLWYELHVVQAWPHVEVFTLQGTRQVPEQGLTALTGYNI